MGEKSCHTEGNNNEIAWAFFFLLHRSTFSAFSTLCSHFSVLGSRFSLYASRVLQLKFIYFYCFCSFWATIYEQRNIYLYIDIYMFRVGSVLRQFYSILFYFEWKVHTEPRRIAPFARFEWKRKRNNLLVFFCPRRRWKRSRARERRRTRGNILSYFALNFNRI